MGGLTLLEHTDSYLNSKHDADTWMVAYPEAPSLQVPVALGHQQHQLCLRSTPVKEHQPNRDHTFI